MLDNHVWLLAALKTHSSTCTAAAGRELHTAEDMAAVLYWRFPEPAPTDPEALSWLPGIPEELHDHPAWGQYLAKRPS